MAADNDGKTLMEIIFGTPLPQNSEEWERLQRIHLHKLSTYELECLADEVSCLLHNRRQEESNE